MRGLDPRTYDFTEDNPWQSGLKPIL